jgi:hypothetical protein
VASRSSAARVIEVMMPAAVSNAQLRWEP